MITQDYLKECLHYDPKTGVFTWKKRPLNHFHCKRGFSVFNSQKAGKRADSKRSDGYSEIRFKKNRRLAHIYAWLYFYGEYPNGKIDHKNQNKSDNRISNLRIASSSDNNSNVKSKGVTSKYLGVHVCGKSGKFIATCQKGKRNRMTKSHNIEIEAAKTYDKMAMMLHGRFSSLNFPCLCVGDYQNVIVEISI